MRKTGINGKVPRKEQGKKKKARRNIKEIKFFSLNTGSREESLRAGAVRE